MHIGLRTYFSINSLDFDSFTEKTMTEYETGLPCFINELAINRVKSLLIV